MMNNETKTQIIKILLRFLFAIGFATFFPIVFYWILTGNDYFELLDDIRWYSYESK
jgi:hypothetical protein